MKIVKKVSNIIDLEIRQVVFSIRFLLALIGFGIAIPGVVSILQNESVILECKYLELYLANCDITRTNLLGKKKTINFPLLKKAEIETIDNDDTTTYRINLVGGKEDVSLTSYSIPSKSETEKKVKQINNFLTNDDPPSPYFTVKYGYSFSLYIQGFIYACVGGLMSFFILTYSDNTNYILDKENNTLWKIKKMCLTQNKCMNASYLI